MVTGEDIVATVMKESEHKIIITDSFRMVYIPSELGKLSMAMVPWVMNSFIDEPNIEIKQRDIIFMAEASMNLIKFYMMAKKMYNDSEKDTILEQISASEAFEDEDDVSDGDIENLQSYSKTLSETDREKAKSLLKNMVRPEKKKMN